MLDFYSKFELAMKTAGLFCPAPIIADGTIHRFGLPEDRGEKPCWYALHVFPNGFACGVFGCFKRDLNEKWHSRDIKLLSSGEQRDVNAQLKAMEEKRKIEQQKIWGEGAKEATEIWNNATAADNDHPYLKRKGVENYGLKTGKDGELLIPLMDSDGTFHGLQRIFGNGDKRFLFGTNKKSHYYRIDGTKATIYLAEGYATGASVHQATNAEVIVTFDAGNLPSVAESIRKKYPHAEIVICADNDAFKETGNTGLNKATEAAEAIKAKLITPRFKNIETKPTDFNDLMRLEGIDEVRKQLLLAEEIPPPIPDEPEKQTQASKIIELVKDVELFHDEQGSAYATFEANGHKETWALHHRNFQDWLGYQCWSKHHKAMNRNLLQDVLTTLQGQARFDGACQNVYTRIAMIDRAMYIDLGNENWEAIMLTQDGWEVLENPPIKFIRTPNMQAFPTPVRGGNFDIFWQYVNIPEKYRKLILAYILECFRPNTPFPILVLSGIQGSAKSTTQELIRMLIDPSSSSLRSAPKKSDDLYVAAANNYIVSLNNVSHLSEAQQDDLCCLATGGSFSTRELFTTHNEAVVSIKRPVIINGIGDLITAQDLIDRCLILELPEISEQGRKTEEEIKVEFNQQYPQIFGALLHVLSAVLKELPHVKLDRKPRMADFAIIGTALENVMGWERGSFMTDYNNNRKDNLVGAMEHSPVAVALACFIDENLSYEGNYACLYRKLSLARYKPDMVGWPKSAKGLSHQIKRQKPALAAIGIEVIHDPHRHEDGHRVYIKKLENKVQQVQHVQETNVIKDSMPEHRAVHREHDPQCTAQVQPCSPRLYGLAEHHEHAEH